MRFTDGTSPPPIRAELSPLRRLGLGRLRGAAWTSDHRLVFGTTAGLFSLDVPTGRIEELVLRYIDRLSISPDRRLLLVSVEGPRQILLLRAEDGSLVMPLEGHGPQIVETVGFSSDGALIATGGTDRRLCLYRAADGERIAICTHPKGFLESSGSPKTHAFAPDGLRVCTADEDGNVYIWDIEGEMLGRFRGGRWVHAMMFSPDGKHLILAAHPDVSVSSGEKCHLQIRALDGSLAREIAIPAGGVSNRDIRALALSPDQTLLAAGGKDEHVHLVCTSTWERVSVLDRAAFDVGGGEHENLRTSVHALAFSPNGAHLHVCISPPGSSGSAGEDQISSQIFRVSDLRRTYVCTDFLSRVSGLALSTDGLLIFGTCRGAFSFDARLSAPRWLTSRSTRAVALSPDGKTILVGGASFDGEASLVDLETGNTIRDLPLPKGAVEDAAFSPLGGVFATACKQAQIWKESRKTAVRITREHSEDVVALAFSPDGKLLATASWDHTVRLWEAPKFTPYNVLENPAKDRFNAVAFSPDKTKIACVGYDGALYVFRVEEGGKPLVLGAEEPRKSRTAVAFSSDGRFLVDGSWHEGELRLFRVADGALLKRVRAHGARVTKLVFSSDGAQIYSASEDGTVRIWALSAST